MDKSLTYDCSYGEETLKKVQSVLFEMLCRISRLFDQHGVRYFLTYGTLIGAVRHKDFIPWDDDLDICVLREDYDRAIQLLRDSLPESYVVHDRLTDPIYWLEFSKIRYRNSETHCALWPEDNQLKYRGVCLDIFRCWEDKGNLQIIEKYQVSASCIRSHLGRFGKTLSPVAAIKAAYHGFRFSFYYFARFFCTRRKYWSDPVSLFPPVEAEDLFPLGKQEFNGQTFPVPGNYDRVLSRYYGKYMELPAVEKRKPHYDSVTFFD